MFKEPVFKEPQCVFGLYAKVEERKTPGQIQFGPRKAGNRATLWAKWPFLTFPGGHISKMRNCRIFHPEKGGGVRSTKNGHFDTTSCTKSPMEISSRNFPEFSQLPPDPPEEAIFPQGLERFGHFPPPGRSKWSNASGEMSTFASYFFEIRRPPRCRRLP